MGWGWADHGGQPFNMSRVSLCAKRSLISIVDGDEVWEGGEVGGGFSAKPRDGSEGRIVS